MRSTELPPELRLNQTQRSADSQELCECLTELDYLGKGLNKRCYPVITLRRSIINVALNQSDFYGSDQTQASKSKESLAQRQDNLSIEPRLWRQSVFYK